MRKQILTFLLALLISPAVMFAQATKTVKGTVIDQDNQPVIGATVKVNGTTISTATDFDGCYELKNVPENAVISYSFIGMKSKDVRLDGRSTVNVTLLEDTQNLEEVVVIGYGAAKAKDLTAPIEVVKGEELIVQPTSSPMAALQGKVPGVNIVNSGTPGAGPKVTIRGNGSFGDTSPLYVVDGMFYDNIDFLNNADIQEMSVLKDASASAIYGVRAANGVVIITTKKGRRNQGAQITYNGYVGIQKATNVLEMCNSHEYATMLMEANPDAYRHMFEKSIAEFGGDMETLTFNADTNWYDEMLRTAVITNHSLNISGGSNNAIYSVGMSYLSQDGIMDVENYYRRMNFRASLDFDATSWLKVGFNGVFSNSQQQLPNNAAWQKAFNTPSILPVYDERRGDDVFPTKYADPSQVGLNNNFYNPVAFADYYDSRNDNYQVLSNFYAQLNIIPDRLNIRTSYSYDYSAIRGNTFLPTYYVGQNQQRNTTQLTKTDSNYNKWIWDNTATYNQRWDAHSFTGMLGVSMRQERYNMISGTATNVPEGADEWKYLVLGNKEGSTVTDDGWRYRGLSYFTRLNYSFDDRYMLMFTFRADGSSKYNDKWGYFPSVGAAWTITNEEFMADQKAFDYLKLRASWGKLGNDKIAASAGFANVKVVQAVFGTNNPLDGYKNTSNFSWLGWEVVNETNVGLSLATLRNRLSADIDWYYRMTENAVISPMIPMTTNTIAGNYGEVLNSGVDLSLNWNDKINKDFSYNIGFNLGWLHNEVKSLKGDLNYIKDGGKVVQMVGEKMNSYYGYKVVGIYQTAEECANDPIAVANNLQPGDFKYQDVNGDDKIDGQDKQVLGSYIPDITYGFNLGFQYKNFDFALSTYGQAGGELWNRKRALRYAQSDYNFDKAQFENRWTGAGSTNEHPSAAALIRTWNVSDSNNASYFVEKSNYFRIQNITLGYSFKNIKMGNYTMPGIRLTLTADRPFTTFKCNSFTPELSDAAGWDTEVYPLTATYTFGVQIDF
ncbi:MAG: TonB-dependent receptor [Muribaculaceae bacterium]|nr:TonB-dependent receptor [Muribaculaceae bacterium]